MKYYVSLFLAFIAISISAIPLTGTYTVGGASASFTTLTSAIAAANTNGLGTDVTFDLNPGTYSGALEVNISPNTHRLLITAGTDPANQVILNNPSASSTQNYILKLNNTPNISIIGVTFAANGVYSRSIYAYGNCSNLIVQTNRFIYTNAEYTDSNEAIYFEAYDSQDSDNVLISTNAFTDGGWHVYAISNYTFTQCNSWQIYHNTHSGGYGAVIVNRMADIQITEESIINSNNGIWINSGLGSLNISKNVLQTHEIGLVVSGYDVLATTSPQIFNNLITVCGYAGTTQNSTIASRAFQLDGTYDIIAVHNTVLNQSQSNISYAASVGGLRNTIRNNQFISSGNGYGFVGYNVEATTSDHNVVERNNIYTTYTYIAKSWSIECEDLSEFNTITGTTNYSMNPVFTDTALHTVAPRLNNLGLPSNLTTDYSGATRSATTPDIGAYEYTSNPALTPLSGNINIGTGGQYTTLAAFTADLTLRGVNAPVTAILTNTLYTEQFVLDVIPGASYANSLTFRGLNDQEVIIRYSTQTYENNYIAKFIRSKHIVMHGLTFETLATMPANVVLLYGYNYNLRFQNSVFTAPTGASFSNVGVPYSSIANDVEFTICEFNGNAYGVSGYGASIRVINSWFNNQSGAGVYLSAVDYASVTGSIFNGTSGYAINISTCNNVTVTRNSITGTHTGIYASSNTAPAGTRTLIANNTIKITGNSNNYGINLGGSDLNVLNNSIWCEGDYGIALYCYTPGSNVDVVNNILAAPQGLAMELTHYTPSADKVVDYNCYYTQANNLVLVGSYYSTLTDLQAALPTINAHSKSLNPRYTADLHTQSPWLRRNGQTRTEFTTDIDGEVRTGGYDIGADQQTTTDSNSPLQGSYTVGNASCDFATIEAAIHAIEFYGISANVFMSIVPGTYSGYYTITDYPVTATGFSIAWTAQPGCLFSFTPTSQTSSDNFLFKLIGVDNMSFNGFVITSITSGYLYSTLFPVSGKCDNLAFNNCTFNLTNFFTNGITTGSSSGAGITVSGCTFNQGITGVSVGYIYSYYNMYWNVLVQNCVFNGTQTPLSISRATNVEIKGNTFTGFSSITLSYISGTASMHHNRLFSSGIYSTATLVSLTNITGTSANPFLFYNNIIRSVDNACQALIGLSLSYSNYLLVDHNTVSVTNESSGDYGSAVSVYQCDNATLTNNIFASPLRAYAVAIDGTGTHTWNKNAYYGSGMYLGTKSGIKYLPTDFITTQLNETGGILANPLVDANGYATCSYLRGKGVVSNVLTDIDGVAYGATPNLGATAIFNYGAIITTSKTVGTSGDYPSLAAAFLDYQRRGISGNVTLYISGNHTGNAELGYIPNSLSNSLTIFGNPGNTLIYNAISVADNYIIKLTNTYNVTLSHLTLSTTGTGNARGIDLRRYTKNVVITACTFSAPAYVSTGNNNCAIIGESLPFTNIKVEDCTIANFAYGIYLSGMQNNAANCTGIELYDNTITNPYMGITIFITTNPILIANIVQNFHYIGLQLSNDLSNVMVTSNQITGNGNAAMMISGFASSPGEQTINNNYIRITGPIYYGMYLSAANAKVYYNTIALETTNASSYGFVQYSGSTGLQFANNICSNTAGYAAYFGSMSDITRLDHSLFYSTGTTTLQIGSNNINTFQALATAIGNSTCNIANPMFDGSTYMLLGSSPAISMGIDIAGITYDINGSPRQTPEIGCWEYGFGTLPPPPAIFININESTQMVFIAWDAVSNATSYILYKSSSPDFIVFTTEIVNNTTVQIPLTAGAHFYKVTAQY